MILRQATRIENPYPPRRLVGRQIAAAPAQQVILAASRFRMQFNRSHGDLSLLAMWQAEGEGTGHGRMGQNRLFQFAHVD